MNYRYIRRHTICFCPFFSSPGTLTGSTSIRELLTLIYRSNSKYRKAEILQSAREQIEVVRLLIRLMKDMKQISLGKFVKINVVVENVSKQ